MKKFLLFTLVAVFLFSTVAMAHPPQNLNVKFNMEDKMLTVEVTHNVGGSNTNHYIEEVTVTYNDEKIVMQKPGQQLNNKELFYYYMPGLKDGDEITINTNCSIQGNRDVNYTITSATAN